MDVGALFLVSHATAMQNVSEVYISPTVTKTFKKKCCLFQSVANTALFSLKKSVADTFLLFTINGLALN
jgi:hypothetical protein